MTIQAWRIVKRKYLRTATSGEGARRFGGRWNSPGVSVVYVAATQSLAILEVLVNLDAAALIGAFSLLPVEFDDTLVEEIDTSRMPRRWRTDPPPPRLREIGDAWVHDLRSAVLAVPSAVVPAERNYLLNPGHPDFARVVVGSPIHLHLDQRLLK